MLFFPGSKINIGLSVGGPRSDGYHSIRSVFFPIPFTDILELTRSESYSFVQTGHHLPGPSAENLVWKAHELLRSRTDLPPLRTHLHKIVPAGAGLGGGSADAACFLKAALRISGRSLPDGEVENMALELGSDCPFFLRSGPQLVEGRGEIMYDTGPDLSGKYLVILFSGIHVSTVEAYRDLNRKEGNSVTEFHAGNVDIQEWGKRVWNDFEESVFLKHHELAHQKKRLLDAGAFYASMSGSGSAVFGLFVRPPGITGTDVVFSGKL
ncbi:MAG: 4-(cytidine 5'-diphospho)-2-C-methyl-D-erythritol kinase [Bacteroidia bacterium]|nr:4-(cytidine 5'-diphospho)-2-C-methyl-D-erythritol kinase [Bacteroidia bacterium]